MPQQSNAQDVNTNENDQVTILNYNASNSILHDVMFD